MHDTPQISMWKTLEEVKTTRPSLETILYQRIKKFV